MRTQKSKASKAKTKVVKKKKIEGSEVSMIRGSRFGGVFGEVT